MSTETQRAEFEAIAVREGLDVTRGYAVTGFHAINQDVYRANDTQQCWQFWQAAQASQAAEIEELKAENERLNAIINSPQADDFLRAVSTEAEHQRQRWGVEHDSGKEPSDWFWLIGYLAGKALNSHAGGNIIKAEHHIITTAAACANWHRAMFGETDMRPGIDGESAMQTKETT